MPVPGPAALGRGVVVTAGDPVPDAWRDAPVVDVDDAALADPDDLVRRLHDAWATRTPVVVALAVDPTRFRTPAPIEGEPWSLSPDTEEPGDRLHFLIWANTYDARAEGDPVWWWGRKAARLGATETPEGPGDLVLADGSPAWVDGGPRGTVPAGFAATDPAGGAVIASATVAAGALVPDRSATPDTGDLTVDQAAAVAHPGGPARVIAPAGSGKTRVLTERLRHLVVDRGWAPEGVLAVAYNKEAQLELERRTTDFTPQVSTLNALGLRVLRAHRGTTPTLLGERDVRRLVDDLLPRKRRHRANTDPIGPYLEALGAVRLGLRDPAEVEASRDDVDGFTELFGPYRARLAEAGAIDFDEQIYGAVAALLSDGSFRRAQQARYRHLLVDEFQDLTPAHVLLLRLLALPELDVFGVGDDDQVIYDHQSASPDFLIDYATLFPHAASLPLTVNHRSPGAAIDAARNLLNHNRRRLDKTIRAAPGTHDAPDAFGVTEHDATDAAATVVDQVATWLAEPGVTPADVAILCRVNSLLLAPRVALADAGIPVSATLDTAVLSRTGLRAALAYLRLATAGGRMAASDIVEILRRPTRGLPRWFPDRLARRGAWSVAQVRAIAERVPENDVAKVQRLADDLAAVQAAASGGTTRAILEAVRDGIGLGAAMGQLDQSGRGAAQGSSHLDDLEGLLTVADLHPEPAGFEAWLRALLDRPDDPDGVTLSTVHRVKGREWSRVAVFGVIEGVLPHRLADDIEAERRVLHVAVTRGRHRVVVLGDRERRSRFTDEFFRVAPPHRPGTPAPTRRTSSVAGKAGSGTAGSGKAGSGNGVARRRRTAPEPLDGPAAAAETALRAWRTATAREIGKPAFTVLSDAHLRGIATTGPTTPAELAACDGIGPVKLERWGQEILELLGGVDRP